MVAAKLVTAEELEAMGPASARRELIEGEIVDIPMGGARQGIAMAHLLADLVGYLDTHQAGIAFGSHTGFVVTRNPDSVLAPSVGVVLAERLPERDIWEGFVPFAPDLAVEIELTESYNDVIARKAALYLTNGSKCVWVVRPKPRTVTVFRPDAPEATLGTDDVLDGGDMLPDFQLPLAALVG
jgi:Uma2 family endonuclease